MTLLFVAIYLLVGVLAAYLYMRFWEIPGDGGPEPVVVVLGWPVLAIIALLFYGSSAANYLLRKLV